MDRQRELNFSFGVYDVEGTRTSLPHTVSEVGSISYGTCGGRRDHMRPHSGLATACTIHKWNTFLSFLVALCFISTIDMRVLHTWLRST